MRKPFQAVGVCTIASLIAGACMDRPVAPTEPQTSNLYVEPIRNEVIDKIDLLFMIDNSQSMGDKQKLLAEAVPQLVDRLVVPRCVNPDGAVKARASQSEACPAGFAPEFRAVEDIHIGVITSSLGTHGGLGGPHEKAVCSGGGSNDDHAQLLAKVRTTPPLDSYANSGFLAWDPRQKLTPPGDKDAAHLGDQFGKMVQAAGEDGCGFEASLESWYRFLIDPEPPSSISVGADGRSQAGPPDQELLAQRKAFLRPDSLVAIVMLTDENDCSIRDDEFGNWLATVGDDRKPSRATSACEKDPNDRCCLPCAATGGIPEGCTLPSADAACKLGNLTQTESPRNLRCWDNKRRFGYDFLYPTSRYVDALTKPLVRRRSDQQMVENPLFASVPGVARRTTGLVYLAGIVGVPWQDIADQKSLSGQGLRYLSASELETSGRWGVILGDPSQNTPPSDPFMRESTQPRIGTNPVTGDSTVPETSLDPSASPINGHEQKDLGGDLQYACTFKLKEAVPCTADVGACDCHASTTADGDELARNRPLCQPPTGGAPVATQYYGKAYPGLRPLQVLRGLGDSAIVASICPKVQTVGQPGYGYEPAVDAIIDRLKVALAGRCLPRPLAAEPGLGGKLPCAVVEAAESKAGSCSCNAAGRRPASTDEQSLVLKQLAERQNCGVPGAPACSASAFCMCELAQSEGASLDDCLNKETGSDIPGYCYVDPYGEQPQGNPALVASCDPASRRLIRFVGRDTPTPGATTFIACLGAALH